MSDAEAYTIDWVDATDRLVRAATDERDWYATVAAQLVAPEDRIAFDVGCGGAGMTVALAEILPHDGLVVAADHAPAMLDAARTVVGAARPRARVVFAVVDLDAGAGSLRTHGPADLVWASASVHHAGDQQAAVDALAALLAPGGRLALAEGGLRPRYLPWDVGVGEPGLELRLETAHDRWFGRMRTTLPNSRPMPYGWTEALRRAGLRRITTRTLLLELPVPLAPASRSHVVASLTERVERLRGSGLVSADDLAAWDTLLDPDHEAWVGHRDDLCSIEARSVHLGVRTPD